MDHHDHVGLLRAGVVDTGNRWLELGAGEGAFTLALADLLGAGGDIVALDREARALQRLQAEMALRFPSTHLVTTAADFRRDLPTGPFDGVLAANSLHFVPDPGAVLSRARATLRPGGRLLVVEYDADRGNPWVPHPFSAARFAELAASAGFEAPREIARVPSRFLGAIYAAAADRGIGPEPVLHSRPHGGDREE